MEMAWNMMMSIVGLRANDGGGEVELVKQRP